MEVNNKQRNKKALGRAKRSSIWGLLRLYVT